MPLRDAFPTCPRCRAALDPRGDRHVCTGCDGALVTEPVVSQLIADMIGDQVSALGWAGKVAEPQPLAFLARSSAQTLVCPCCDATMETLDLYGIAVDRCAAHGVWFDKQELADTLTRAYDANKITSTRGERVYMKIVFAGYIAARLLQAIYAHR